MKYFAPYIRKIDVFSVPFTPSIDLKSKDVYYSSLIGGLFTIAIHAFVIFYGITLLNQWFNNGMAYKISSQEQNQGSELFANYFNSHNNSEQLIFEIFWNSQPDDSIYPFQNNNTIVIPLLYECYENKTQNLLKFYNESSQQIVWNFNQNKTDYCYYLIILPCINNSQYLDSGQQCASKEETDIFFSKDGIEFDATVTTYGVNFYNNEVSSNSIYTVNFIQNDLSTLKALNIQYTYFEFISGFFSENKRQYLLMTDFSSRDQLGSQDYITKYFRYFRSDFENVYGSMGISANTMIKYVIVQYPSLGEILANIGSIAQTLLLIRFFLEYINRFWMNDEFKAFFINVFFPDFANIQKKRKGCCKSEYYLGDKKINAKSYESLSKTLTEQIEQKMSYSNLIYEVTKMQGVIEDLVTHYQILSNHFKKVDLDFMYCENKNEYSILNYWNKTFENFDEQKRQSFYPFSYNFSIRQQSEQYCKCKDPERELLSSRRNKPEIILNSQLFENEQKL